MTRISLIVPVYNAMPYIKAMAQAVLGQAGQNVQVIFSDDGSTDGTLEYLQALQDSRVQVIAGENRGVSAARNRALAAAEGELIGFLDGDDLPEPEYLNTLEEALVSSGADMACCGFTRVFERTGKTDCLPKGNYTREITDRDGMGRLLLRPDGYTTVMWNKLFTRRALTGEDGELLPFDESLHIVEDGEYLFRTKVEKAVFLPQPLYRYGVRTSGAMYSAAITPRKLTELTARRRIVTLTGDMAEDVQQLAKMKYQKGLRDLMFHAVIGGQRKAVAEFLPELSVFRRELFESPALSQKEKLKYHIYRPIIQMNLRHVGAFLMDKLSGH